MKLNNVFRTVLPSILFLGGVVFADLDFPTIKSITASSTLPDQGKNSYSAQNLLEHKLESVWAATFDGKPITLELEVEAFEINELEILNGYRRDQKSYTNNSRAKKINIYADSKENLVKSVTLTDFKWEYCMGVDQPKECPKYLKSLGIDYVEDQVTCSDVCSPLHYTEDILFKPAIRDVKKLIVEIESIYPGKKWKDVCITDISINGKAKNTMSPNYNPEFGEVTDARDGHKYKTLKIGGVNWLAENLNYNEKGSSCYENSAGKKGSKDKTCNKKGRVYKKSAVRDELCPQGWRLPSNEEFVKLGDSLRSYSEQKFSPFEDLFDEDLSSNGFGMNVYNLDDICICRFCAGDHASDVYEIASEITGRLKGFKGSTIPRNSVFWVKPYKSQNSDMMIPFTLVSTDEGFQTPSEEMVSCLNDRSETEHRKDFFVRCVEK